MTYYSYNHDHYSYVGDNYQTPYGGNYDIVPFQSPGDDSGRHGFHNQSFSEYSYHQYSYVGENYQTPYYGACYDSPMNGSSLVSYSVSSFSEPKSILYDPYSDGYGSQFRISYSVQEFNEPEFEEYDPTPYGGGYDLALTYGKPLPPSEATCYPRSSPDSSAPPALIPKINVEEPAQKPETEDKQQIEASNEDEKRSKEYENIPETSPEKPSGPIQVENHSDEGNGDEYDEKRVTQIPSGYGLEAVDLCESLFGYWPCLDRYNKERHDCRQVCSEESFRFNQWKETADYFFGSSNPYGNGERRDGISGYGNTNCDDYQRHYQEQSLHTQVDNYDEEDHSWMDKFRIF